MFQTWYHSCTIYLYHTADTEAVKTQFGRVLQHTRRRIHLQQDVFRVRWKDILWSHHGSKLHLEVNKSRLFIVVKTHTQVEIHEFPRVGHGHSDTIIRTIHKLGRESRDRHDKVKSILHTRNTKYMTSEYHRNFSAFSGLGWYQIQEQGSLHRAMSMDLRCWEVLEHPLKISED